MRVVTTKKAYKGDEAAEWAALQRQVVGMSFGDMARHIDLFLVRHSITISVHELVLLRDRKDHQALTALRLAILAGLVPVESWPRWINDDVSVRPVPIFPPLVGARSTTAPPCLPANASSRVKGFLTN